MPAFFVGNRQVALRRAAPDLADDWVFSAWVGVIRIIQNDVYLLAQNPCS